MGVRTLSLSEKLEDNTEPLSLVFSSACPDTKDQTELKLGLNEGLLTYFDPN